MTDEDGQKNIRFNLLDEPWIPVIDDENKNALVSIKDALINARNYKTIDTDLATERAAVTRLLIAFIYASTDLTVDNWKEYWENGFPEDVINSYADKWHDRFWLIHPTHPFMQAADLELEGGRTLPLFKIVSDIPNGAPMFYTKTKDMNKISYSTASVLLLASLWYDACGPHAAGIGDPRTGTVPGAKGRVYPTNALLAGMTNITATGRNLLETFLLSTPATDSDTLNLSTPDLAPGENDDRPIWEGDPLHVGGADKDHRIVPRGVIQELTLPTRKIKLFDNGEVVTGCIVSAGDAVDLSNGYRYEQMCSWKLYKDSKDAPPVWKPIHRSEERALWRGINALLADYDDVDQQYRKPTILDWDHELFRDHVIPSDYKIGIDAVTARYDVSMSSAVTDILEDHIPMPVMILDDKDKKADAIKAVSLVDKASKAYWKYVNDIGWAIGNPEGPSQTELSTQRALFYASIEPLYYDWIGNAGSIDEWKSILRDKTLTLASEYSSSSPSVAIIGVKKDKRIYSTATAEMAIRRDLNKL